MEDEKWSLHLAKLGTKSNSKAKASYWFCAQPRRNHLEQGWTNVNVEGTLVVVSGKWGYNDTFKNSVDQFRHEVERTGYFTPQNIFCYSQSPNFVLSDKRFTRHLQYRIDPDDVSKRGGGYWLHKPLTLRHHMDYYKDGALIVWVDLDRRNFLEQGHFNAVVETLEKRDADIVVEQNAALPESIWTKEDMLRAFNASTATRSSGQLNANAIVIRNSRKMRSFMDAWIDCMANWHMVSDEASIYPNRNGFKEHRHDQSLLGMLVQHFMMNKTVVGPPARQYTMSGFSALHTYTLDEHRKVFCPF
jgi:galactosyl transferase GMA12/MNN10 family